MQLDYQELRQEIKEITTVDGFVAACLEIKESMFFYERDLMLAAYSASLELLTVTALFTAALKGSRQLQKAEEEIGQCLDQLVAELNQYHLPLDLQYVADRYIQEAGFNTGLRMPVYKQMIREYAFVLDDKADLDLDGLLRAAHRAIYQDKPPWEAKINAILGQVGARMLRGARLRPIWLEISHPRLYLILIGLQTLVCNFRVTPYFTFPFESMTTERQKRKKIAGSVVLDLGAFRNFREGGSGYTDLSVSLSKDEADYFLENLFVNPDYLQIESDEAVLTLITAVLEARLVNPEIKDNFLLKLLIYCDLWQLSQVSDVVLELLSVLDSQEPLFHGFWTLLQGFGNKALPAVRRFVRAHRESPFLAELADFLADASPGRRRWGLITEIFEHYPREDETKVAIAFSIARCGGAQAVKYLREALANTYNPKDNYGLGLKKALKYAQNFL